MSKWSFFGCGPGGLYSAWRLVNSAKVKRGDSINLFDWGHYRFEPGDRGTRSAAGRICTYYQNNPMNTYVEVGGMRYSEWDQKDPKGAGHRLVTRVIDQMGLSGDSVPFNTTMDPLFYLRQKHFYSTEIKPETPAPYYADDGRAGKPPSAATNDVAVNAGIKEAISRRDACKFYREGRLPDGFKSQVFKTGDLLRNIGYWNLMYDQLGSEGYKYVAAGGGYQSNVINWNSADAVIYNNEFTPGLKFKTLKTGYSSIFEELFQHIVRSCEDQGIKLNYHPRTRLRSIWLDAERDDRITFTLARANTPDDLLATDTTDYAFLAMPPGALEIVAQGSRYKEGNIVDVLNAEKVALYRESVIKQPSYKVAMFFKTDWWKKSKYPPRLDDAPINEGARNVFGPTITDEPLRQIYYFGNNAQDKNAQPVYALLASYDDEQFVKFWQEMELTVQQSRTIPISQDTQPLKGPRKATPAMVNSLREQLATVHNGPGAKASSVPMPLETVFMDWSLKPFAAGYHAWAAHYDINDVMQKIRKPTQLIDGHNANLFIVGSAYSNDQAWVEGAFCTSESVLTDFLGVPSILSPKDRAEYPYIC